MADIKRMKGYGLADLSARKTTDAFDAYEVTLYNDCIHEIIDGATYAMNPFRRTVNNGTTVGTGFQNGTEIHIYDDEMNELTTSEKNWGGCVKFAYVNGKTRPYAFQHNLYKFNGDVLTISGAYVTGGSFTVEFKTTPKYISFHDKWTVGAFMEDIPYGRKNIVYKDETCVGLLEQIDGYVQDSVLTGFDTSEMVRRMKNEMVHTNNSMRDAIRVSPFNIYGANYHKQNWDAVREFLQNYGCDIVGFTECYDPLGSGTDGLKFADVVGSWDLQSFSTVGERVAHLSTVATGKGFEIVSSEEVKYTDQSNYGSRYYTKCEIQLPMYNNRKWSEKLKLSFYCTQLELSESTGKKQAQQICDAVASDPNPFVIVAGDFNDETYAKTVWQVFAENGLTPIFDSKGSPTAGRGWYDNLFVSSRISKVASFVECIDNHRFSNDNWVTSLPISDHAFPYADLHLDYSDIVTVKKVVDGVEYTGDSNGNAEITGVGDWFSRSDGTITVNLVPAEGYRIKSVEYWDGDWSLPSGKYPTGIIVKDGNTITFDADKVYGDMCFKVVTEAE